MKKTLTYSAWKKAAKFYKNIIKVPHRPSVGELRIYEDYIKKLVKEGKKTALVLGATPGIRDILAKYNFEATLLDVNFDMIKAMGSLVRRKKRSEKIVIGNWIKMPFKENSFDIALGDHSYSNIDFKKWDKLSKEIIRVLKPDGYHIHNMNIALPEKLSFEGLIKKYRQNPELFRDYKNKVLYQYQVYTSDPRIYNRKIFKSDWEKYDNILAKFYRVGKISKKELKILGNPLSTKGFKFYLPPKKIVDKLFKKYFRIIKVKHNKAHPVFKRYQIYLMKNKDG